MHSVTTFPLLGALICLFIVTGSAGTLPVRSSTATNLTQGTFEGGLLQPNNTISGKVPAKFCLACALALSDVFQKVPRMTRYPTVQMVLVGSKQKAQEDIGQVQTPIIAEYNDCNAAMILLEDLKGLVPEASDAKGRDVVTLPGCVAKARDELDNCGHPPPESGTDVRIQNIQGITMKGKAGAALVTFRKGSAFDTAIKQRYHEFVV